MVGTTVYNSYRLTVRLAESAVLPPTNTGKHIFAEKIKVVTFAKVTTFIESDK